MKKEKKRVSFPLPSSVENAIASLEEKGYQAYLVGGAIRDMFFGLKPKDYDLASDARPEEIAEVFHDLGIYTKNFQHDTVNVHFADQDIEITAFRGEKDTIESDLGRRDFTLDALAYSPKEGLIDPYEGKEDIASRVLRCTYLPKDDFEEDPIRILRAIRLAGKYHLEMEGKTSNAMHRYAPLLKRISPERIREEFLAIIVLKDADQWIREYLDVFEVFLPELRKMEGFKQHSPYHEFDVLEHSLHALHAVKDRNPALCTATLFHDVGKPDTFFFKDGCGHFYGHADKGEEIVKQILTRLKCSNDFMEEVSSLVKWHMVEIKEKKTVKRLMNRLTPKVFYELLELREADIKGCTSRPPLKIPYVEALKQVYQSILDQKEPFSLKDLKIDGNDLLALGLERGPEVGAILKSLLLKVEDGSLPNEREPLLLEAKKEIEEKKKAK